MSTWVPPLSFQVSEQGFFFRSDLSPASPQRRGHTATLLPRRASPCHPLALSPWRSVPCCPDLLFRPRPVRTAPVSACVTCDLGISRRVILSALMFLMSVADLICVLPAPYPSVCPSRSHIHSTVVPPSLPTRIALQLDVVHSFGPHHASILSSLPHSSGPCACFFFGVYHLTSRNGWSGYGKPYVNGSGKSELRTTTNVM